MPYVLNRRRFLSGLGALAAGPVFGAVPANPDVVIVGAGMAGLTAARFLIKNGITVAVLEARERIGGRAYTESATFGVPYDHGCAWLHSADQNPVTKIASELGFNIVEDDGELWLYLGDREATDDEYEVFEEYFEALASKLDDAGEDGDGAGSDVWSSDNALKKLAHDVIGPLEHGVELAQLSTGDYNAQIGTGDERLVKEGLGSVVEKFGRAVPVKFSAAVKRIRWNGNGVGVESVAGTLKAKAVLITVSNGVLGSGALTFEPELPDWKNEAVASVPMGVLEKITLQYKAGLSEAGPGTHLLQARDDGRTGDFLLRPFGSNLAVGFVGGKLAVDLLAAGDAEAVAFKREVLRDVFGSEIDQHFVKGHVTRWHGDPWALGAYSASQPGRNRARKQLIKPVGDRIFFAGEAGSTLWATQLPGAYLTAIESANRIQRSIR